MIVFFLSKNQLIEVSNRIPPTAQSYAQQPGEPGGGEGSAPGRNLGARLATYFSPTCLSEQNQIHLIHAWANIRLSSQLSIMGSTALAGRPAEWLGCWL